MFEARLQQLPKPLTIAQFTQSEDRPFAFDPISHRQSPSNTLNEHSMQHNEQPRQFPNRNRRAVRLSQVPPHKLIVLTKNRVTKDQLIKVPMKQEYLQPAQSKPVNVPLPAESTQSISENDVLFNYDKIAQQRRQRKQNFLNTIQNKLQVLEHEAQQLQQDFRQDQQQLLQMNEINTKVNKDLHDYHIDRKLSKLQKEVDEAINQKDNQMPFLINPVMTANQINENLGNMYQQNDRLFHEIEARLAIGGSDKEKKSMHGTGMGRITIGFGNTANTISHTPPKPKKSRSKSKGKKLTSTFTSTLKKAM